MAKGTYSEGNMPDSEKLTDSEAAHGFNIGDAVEFVKDVADDVRQGNRAVVVRLDDHPTMPVTVDVHKAGGLGFLFGLPVKVDEIARVLPDVPAEGAVSAPEALSDASGGQGEGDDDSLSVAAA